MPEAHPLNSLGIPKVYILKQYSQLFNLLFLSYSLLQKKFCFSVLIIQYKLYYSTNTKVIYDLFNNEKEKLPQYPGTPNTHYRNQCLQYQAKQSQQTDKGKNW